MANSRVERPTDASIILTYRCPMRCQMCNIWKNPTKRSEEIKAEEYGDYYAWGETETKYSYDEAVCETMGKDIDDICGTCLDVAHVKWGSPYLKWGGAWRMPTKEEFDELENKCIYEWTEHNGVKGYKLTSKINGKSIFLPAAGSRVATERRDLGKKGFYWSSTQVENSASPQNSHDLYFTDREIETSSTYYRGLGFSVRPVTEKNK